MKIIIQRFLVFFIGIPLIISSIIFLPYYDHLFLNIVVVIFSVLGAVELKSMLKNKQLPISKIEAVILGGLAPALMTLVISFDFNFWIIPVFLVAAAIWMLVSTVFMPSYQLDMFINRMVAGFAVLIYPGFFLAWICAMGKWNGILIIVFVILPMLNDSAAWAAGILFGKNNRGIIKVSPKKSIAGYTGGLVASILVTTLAVIIFPGFFNPRFGYIAIVSSPVVCGVLLGIIPGIAAALGDLCESAMKRSANIKDSGSLIPGRGGVLDSIDSIALAAPAFYFTWKLLFTGV